MNNTSHKVSYLGRLLPWFSLFVTCTTLWFIFTVDGIALLAWEFVAFIYVLGIFAHSWLSDTKDTMNAMDAMDATSATNQCDAAAPTNVPNATSATNVPNATNEPSVQPTESSSTDRLDSWAWWLPLITSVAGVYAAIVAMSANAQAKIDAQASVIAGVAACGVALSWFMLHITFANVYAHIMAKHGKESLRFPETTSPTHLDYLYFSLTVGATFATSDVTVRTTRMRRTVTLHSVISFFYNALIVAVVFQVLQQVVATNI